MLQRYVPVAIHFGGSFANKYLFVFVDANMNFTLVNLITLGVHDARIFEGDVFADGVPFDPARVLNQ